MYGVQRHRMPCYIVLCYALSNSAACKLPLYHTMACYNPAGGTDHNCRLCCAAVNQGVVCLPLPTTLQQKPASAGAECTHLSRLYQVAP